MPRPLKTVVVILVIVTFFSSNLMQMQAAGADNSLVIAALDVLKREYASAKPLRVVDLLNAAIAALRKATNLGPEKIPDLPSGLEDSNAVSAFRQEFADAVRIGTMQEADLAYAATRGMLNSLHDSQVGYYDPVQWAEHQQSASGGPDFVGIGISVVSKQDASGSAWLFIDDVYPGSPAQAAGLRRFDRIVEVDGRPIQNIPVLEASGLIRGPAGSTVNLKIKRGGEVLNLSIVRTPIKVPSVDAQLIQPGIAYVRLRTFPDGVGDLFRNQLQALESRGTIVGVILDLRGTSGGGYFRNAASVAGTFLRSDTTIAHIFERDQETGLKASGPLMLQQAKLAILVDKGTAVNAEVVAIAVKDTHRGTIVGENTAGRLGGGHAVALPAGGMFVRLSEVWGPQYDQVEGVGIMPDVEVSLTESDMGKGQDPQLDAALKAVSGG